MAVIETPFSRRRASLTTVLAWVLAVALALTAITAGVLAVVDVPYAVLRPGQVTDALGQTPGSDHPIISVEEKGEVKVYQPGSGHLNFTTVSVQGGPEHPLSALGYLWAHLDPDAQIRREAEVFPQNVTAEEIKEENRMMMAQSQDGAHIVAARAAGYPVTRRVGIAGVMESSPNKDVLRPADDIVRLGTTEVKSLDDLRTGLDAAKPGTSVPLVLRRDGKETTVQVRVERKDDRNVMGILARYQYDTPLKATFDAGRVGGPSAGLMFSLALYDKLTPGDLTGGQSVAGTGTISPEGEVGPIGGIEFKLKGARKAGSSWFLAPKDNCADVAGHEVEGLRVVPVTTFDQAKGVVERIAKGDTGGLPTCS